MSIKVIVNKDGDLCNAHGTVLAKNVFNFPDDHPTKIKAMETVKEGAKCIREEIDRILIEDFLKDKK